MSTNFGIDSPPFKEIYIQPASGDNRTALGAALYVQHHILGRPRRFVMEHAYWGPECEEEKIRHVLEVYGNEFNKQRCRVRKIGDEEELCRVTAERITEGKVVGWFQGRMEWGPRALGNRSIVADPRRCDMREIINTKIKFREKFRPFAPSVLEEALHDYFVGAVPDPFMIQVYPVRPDKRDVIPAVTHVDGSGRLQTVNRHAGNLGLSQGLESLVDAAVLLAPECPKLELVFVGDGAKRVGLEARAQRVGARNIRFLPFLPRDRMRESYGAADLFVISLKPSLSGFIVPSKLYSILATGKPYVAAVDDESEVAAITRQQGCGLLAAPDDAGSLAARLRTLYGDRALLEHLAANARKASEAFDRPVAVRAYHELLTGLVSGRQ